MQKQQVLPVEIDKIVLKKAKNLFTTGGVYARIYSVEVGQRAGHTPISLQNAALPLHTFSYYCLGGNQEWQTSI